MNNATMLKIMTYIHLAGRFAHHSGLNAHVVDEYHVNLERAGISILVFDDEICMWFNRKRYEFHFRTEYKTNKHLIDALICIEPASLNNIMCILKCFSPYTEFNTDEENGSEFIDEVD